MMTLTVIAAGGYVVGIFIMGEELNFSDAVASLSNNVQTAAKDASNAVNK